MSLAAGAPSLLKWAAELLEIPGLLASPLLPSVPLEPGDGRPVMVLPGYLTGDISSIRLRRSLRAAGYAAQGWGLGQNRGAKHDLLERIGARIETLAAETGQAVALVGWSLGGVFAREAAKRHPHAVSLVVTLGSPFSGDPRANNAWRLYEWLNDHRVDNPPFAVELAIKPPVPTVAVWSPIDGIVAPAAAKGLPGESDRQVELHCRHLAMARARRGIELVGRLLANPGLT